MLKVLAVAPRMSPPSLRHWIVGVGLPVMITEKLTGRLAHTVCVAGCPVTAAATFTVRSAVLLVTEPHELLTTQSYKPVFPETVEVMA